MRASVSFLTLSSLLLLSACGTMIDGQMQDIRLDTPGAYEAECIMDNGVRYHVQNGETIKIQRSHKPLELDCYGSGNRHVTKTVESKYNGWAAANVANGVVPGAAYDHFSGGLYEYPSIIMVDFVGVPTSGFELPDYHNKDAPNPYKQSIESYAAGTPRIDEDTAYLKRGITKRDPLAESNPFAASSAGNAPADAGMMPMPSISGPSPKGTTAEGLTRSMNPSVFNN